jgi:3-oxoacyl-[acyl-carrier protein] reductase
VTGGNSGIGRAISLGLARCGAEVALTYFSSTDIDTAGDIQVQGFKAYSIQMDAADSKSVNQAVAKAAQVLDGHIDILVNNAGTMVQRSSIEEMSDELWFSVMQINLSSAFYCSRAVIPYEPRMGSVDQHIPFRPHRYGGGRWPTAQRTGILINRGLAENWPEVPSIQLRRGIVGTAFTGLTQWIGPTENFSAPAGAADCRMVADSVLYLASRFSAFITGATLDINGGQCFINPYSVLVRERTILWKIENQRNLKFSGCTRLHQKEAIRS